MTNFEDLNNCIKFINNYSASDLSKCPILLLMKVGGALEFSFVEIKSKEMINFSKKNNFIGYFEVSPESGENVKEVFEFLVNSIYEINVE